MGTKKREGCLFLPLYLFHFNLQFQFYRNFGMVLGHAPENGRKGQIENGIKTKT